MSETPAKERRRQDEPVELTMETFAELVGNMSRLLTDLGALDPFKEAKLGLAEWVALTLISRSQDVSSRQIARNLGVSDQRANQLADSLKAAGLISVAQSAEGSRKKAIRITQAGRNELGALNGKLEPLLVEPIKAKAKRVSRMVRGIKRLARVVSPRKAKADKSRARRNRMGQGKDESAVVPA